MHFDHKISQEKLLASVAYRRKLAQISLLFFWTKSILRDKYSCQIDSLRLGPMQLESNMGVQLESSLRELVVRRQTLLVVFQARQEALRQGLAVTMPFHAQ